MVIIVGILGIRWSAIPEQMVNRPGICNQDRFLPQHTEYDSLRLDCYESMHEYLRTSVLLGRMRANFITPAMCPNNL